MPPVGFEPTVSAGERPQTYALDRSATGTSALNNIFYEKKIITRLVNEFPASLKPDSSILSSQTAATARYLERAEYSPHFHIACPKTHITLPWKTNLITSIQRPRVRSQI